MADGAHGPGDVPLFVVSDGGTIRRPSLPNWQDAMLGICEETFEWRGSSVNFVTISPRYVGTTLADIRESGGIVGVGRVLDGIDARLWEVLNPTHLDYWGAGVLSIVAA
jgi:hypothetical protein